MFKKSLIFHLNKLRYDQRKKLITHFRSLNSQEWSKYLISSRVQYELIVNQTGDKHKENKSKTGCIDVLANSQSDHLEIVLQSLRRIRIRVT